MNCAAAARFLVLVLPPCQLAVRLQCAGQPGRMGLLVFDQGLTKALRRPEWRAVELISLLLQK